MKTASRLLALSLLASGAFFTTSIFACSTGAWSSTTAGSIAGDPTNGIARVAGKCGLEVTGTGSVIDNTPDGEATFIARFYFFGKNLSAGTHEIFTATSADDGGGTAQFNITYDGTDIIIDAAGGGGTSTSAPALSDKWNLIEVEWNAGAAGSLWVNADATTDAASTTFTSGAGSIGSAELGAMTGIGSEKALFDDYVSHRTLPVGSVLDGDANDDLAVNSGDIGAVVNEFLSGTVESNLAIGQPDCNLDGDVNSGDIGCIVQIFLGNP